MIFCHCNCHIFSKQRSCSSRLQLPYHFESKSLWCFFLGGGTIMQKNILSMIKRIPQSFPLHFTSYPANRLPILTLSFITIWNCYPFSKTLDMIVILLLYNITVTYLLLTNPDVSFPILDRFSCILLRTGFYQVQHFPGLRRVHATSSGKSSESVQH